MDFNVIVCKNSLIWFQISHKTNLEKLGQVIVKNQLQISIIFWKKNY